MQCFTIYIRFWQLYGNYVLQKYQVFLYFIQSLETTLNRGNTRKDADRTSLVASTAAARCRRATRTRDHRLLGSTMRRSTIDIHPNFSEAPDLRSSIPHPKTNFSTIQIASRRILPWPENTIASLFETRFTFRRVWVKEPRPWENISAEMGHLYRRTCPITSVIRLPKSSATSSRCSGMLVKTAGRYIIVVQASGGGMKHCFE